jgi:hypothetical protein
MSENSVDKAKSLRPQLTGGAELRLLGFEIQTRQITAKPILNATADSFSGFQIYVDGELKIANHPLELHGQIRVVTVRLSDDTAVNLPEKRFRDLDGFDSVSEEVSLRSPNSRLIQTATLTFASVTAMEPGAVLLAFYPFQRVTDESGVDWMTDGKLAFPISPPEEAARNQFPYSLVWEGLWVDFIGWLDGKIPTRVHFPDFALTYQSLAFPTFRWIIGEDGLEHLSNGFLHFPKTCPRKEDWEKQYPLDPIPSIAVDKWTEFLTGLAGVKKHGLYYYQRNFRHEHCPFHWVENSENGKVLSDGWSIIPRHRSQWTPGSWEAVPFSKIPKGFWDEFVGGIDGLTHNQLVLYHRDVLEKIRQDRRFRWVAEEGQKWLSDGYYSLPEKRPEGRDWEQYRALAPKAIEPPFWMPFLEGLEGKCLDKLLGFAPFVSAARLPRRRPKPLTERQEKLRNIIGKMWKGGDEGVAVGLCVRFTVKRARALGTAYVIDNPAYGAVYFFATQEEADEFARGSVSRLSLRPIQEHVDHVGDWEGKTALVLATVAAKDFKRVPPTALSG